MTSLTVFVVFYLDFMAIRSFLMLNAIKRGLQSITKLFRTKAFIGLSKMFTTEIFVEESL